MVFSAILPLLICSDFYTILCIAGYEIRQLKSKSALMAREILLLHTCITAGIGLHLSFSFHLDTYMQMWKDTYGADEEKTQNPLFYG